jgi:2-polyprenyl-3-methyl-5-hydroxy-6-metoxy-1,4-benzoquinol methylase
LRQILDLGHQPLANEYLDTKNKRETFPLYLNWCSECTHVQLGIEVSPKKLFRDYAYITGLSRVYERYLDNFIEHMKTEAKTEIKALEIGSNDGSLIKLMKRKGLRSIGVDPAVNIACQANRSELLTVPTFFDQNLADFLAKDFNTIIAFNVFAHNSAPINILNSIDSITSDNANIYVLTSQVDMVVGNQFDTVYHEHINFFNVKSMKALLKRSNLALTDVKIEPVHGDSYLWKINKHPVQQLILEREILENQNGLYSSERYDKFQSSVNFIANKFLDKIENYKLHGYQIAIFGAAAKGSTFFNFVKFTPDFIFDDTPHKINRYSPISNVVVQPTLEAAKVEGKLIFVLTAWNFKDELKIQIKNLRKGKSDLLLTYFPEFRIEELHDQA